MKTVLLSTAYLPPISYVALCLKADAVILESHEHFVKQSYRNRTSIYGAGGKLDLIVPVDHKNLYDKPVSEIHIASDQNWRTIHWRSIESAYRNAPYFEFFESEFKKIYDHEEPLLFQWNLRLMQLLFGLLDVEFNPSFTESFLKSPPGDTNDFRNYFGPKMQQPVSKAPAYVQVFSSKHGFIPGLSAIDLLFNCGKGSREYLQLLGEST